MTTKSPEKIFDWYRIGAIVSTVASVIIFVLYSLISELQKYQNDPTGIRAISTTVVSFLIIFPSIIFFGAVYSSISAILKILLNKNYPNRIRSFCFITLSACLNILIYIIVSQNLLGQSSGWFIFLYLITLPAQLYLGISSVLSRVKDK